MFLFLLWLWWQRCLTFTHFTNLSFLLFANTVKCVHYIQDGLLTLKIKNMIFFILQKYNNKNLKKP